MKYIKKPVVIEAETFEGDNNPFGVITKHQCDYRMCPVCGGDNHPHNVIKHQREYGFVSVGDYVIMDNKGEFSSCKPDIFEKTYEPVE